MSDLDDAKHGFERKLDRTRTQTLRYERSIHLLAQQAAVDEFDRCVEDLAGLTELWKLPATDENERRVIAKTREVITRIMLRATANERDFPRVPRREGGVYLIASDTIANPASAKLRLRAGFWVLHQGFLEEEDVGTLTYRFPSWGVGLDKQPDMSSFDLVPSPEGAWELKQDAEARQGS